MVANENNQLDQIRLEGVPTWRAPENALLDDHDRERFKELVNGHVIESDALDFVLLLHVALYTRLRNVLVSVRVCIS
jgi:hypothetical protein